ncbi:MAG TPA: peptidase, partial [Caldithrix abyssi]|nr:peptidase [Caldithrix abyssi]
MFKNILTLSLLASLLACSPEVQLQKDAAVFLQKYSEKYQQLYYVSARAEWKANTYIVEGDTATENRVQRANEALAAFTGSKENIETARRFLKKKEHLTPIQLKQFQAILYEAANNPQTVATVVQERIKAESEQNKTLFGFNFKIDDRVVSTNDIDRILSEETDPQKRLKAWEASKEVGRELKQGLSRLQQLRNKTVQALGYHDYFSYQVSDYGMSTDEMMAMNRRFIKEIWPLYRELHTYARYALAEKYHRSVPDYLPAHWLPNRWGQDWSSLVEVKGIDLNGVLEEKGAEWLVKQAERFYVSLGFPALPASFYEKSSLYPAPPDAPYKKNNHASAWHLDLDKDIRSLMSVIPTAEWYETTHHELGHIYYY